MNRRCSVIVRTRNSEATIAQALTSLFSQDFKDFDLLVVDSGSRDKTLEIVEAFPHKLMQIEARDYLPGRVLNEAVARVEGDVACFLNSDAVILTPDSLSHLLAPILEEGAAATFARQVPRPDAWPHVRREYARAFPEKGPPPPWLTLSLPFAAIRRDLILKRPFYEAAWASEDTEWGYWARRAGLEVRYVPEALVMHSHNYSLSALYGRRFVEGEADAFIFQTKATLFGSALKAVARTARDVMEALRNREPFDLLQAPLRRTVEAMAYYNGNRLGWERLQRGDLNPGRGARIALSLHESARSPWGKGKGLSRNF